MLRLQDIGFSYRLGGRPIRVLERLSHTFPKGSFTAVRGTSGSGKTTLLNVLGLLEAPTTGSYLVEGRRADLLNDSAQSCLRAQVFGFLFQDYRLLADRSALENIGAALEISGLKDKAERRRRAEAALERVGLLGRAAHLPAELSGGEAQRVAFARAIAKRPAVLLADEPTGNLDTLSRDAILDLIADFHRQGGTVVMVTHDDVAAARAEATLYLDAGTLLDEASGRR